MHCRRENLTGLVGTVSGRWRLPEPREPAPTAPLHVRVNQRDQGLHIAGRERFIGLTDGLGAHVETVSEPAREASGGGST